jgi:hypothetical protein
LSIFTGCGVQGQPASHRGPINAAATLMKTNRWHSLPVLATLPRIGWQCRTTLGSSDKAPETKLAGELLLRDHPGVAPIRVCARFLVGARVAMCIAQGEVRAQKAFRAEAGRLRVGRIASTAVHLSVVRSLRVFQAKYHRVDLTLAEREFPSSSWHAAIAASQNSRRRRERRH